jgi:hypothetical protein
VQAGIQKAIATALATRFGNAGKRLMPRIRKIHNVDELDDLVKAIASAESVKDIRDRLTA